MIPKELLPTLKSVAMYRSYCHNSALPESSFPIPLSHMPSFSIHNEQSSAHQQTAHHSLSCTYLRMSLVSAARSQEFLCFHPVTFSTIPSMNIILAAQTAPHQCMSRHIQDHQRGPVESAKRDNLAYLNVPSDSKGLRQKYT